MGPGACAVDRSGCGVYAECTDCDACTGTGGAGARELRISAEVNDAVIVAIICDRGDRYLSSGLFG